MKDYKPEKIKKIWLQELYAYVNEHLNDTSKPILNDLIKFESDCMTIQVILNTLGAKGMTGPNKVT
jgi:vacuolar-type H+-ATPase subunit C/Vma6